MYNTTFLAATVDLSSVDKWSYGIMVTIIGFCLVIFVLLVIAFILSLFGKVMTAQEEKAKKQTKSETPIVKTVAKKTPVVVNKVEEQTNLVDDKELVAVITAAIAASTGTSPDKLHVKSLRLRQGNRKAWTSEALAEQLNINMY
jgi:sodium pump decarboxylase gamma subunit